MRKYVILPFGMLFINALNAVLGYKLELIQNENLRVLAILFMSATGFGLVGLVLSPMLNRALEETRRTTRRQVGTFGEWLWIALMVALLFLLYRALYIQGPQSLLPVEWRNPAPSQ